jgi:hypothetical protein
MRISLSEVRAFEDFIQRVEDDKVSAKYRFPDGDVNHWKYYADHPHFLMLIGFDEYVAFRNKRHFRDLWFADEVGGGSQTIYRKPSGQWLLLSGLPENKTYNSTFRLDNKETLRRWDLQSTWNDIPSPALEIPLSDVFKKMYAVADKFLDEEKTIWSPRLWTPSEQERQTIILQTSTKRLLTALKSEKMELADLSWRQLEEIVAEVLRAQGLEIHVVRESTQGGRDIIARGELIPGQEPLAIAVEVKHKKVVGRPEVQTAIYQNKQFPAIMFVTSGRFTAGVLREKRLADNQLRLFLKDGDALGDLIRDYSLAR